MASFDEDYCQWLAGQIEVLRGGNPDQLQPSKLAEVLDQILNENQKAIQEYSQQIFRALLNPRLKRADWNTLERCRENMRISLARSPSLSNVATTHMREGYAAARRDAVADAEDMSRWPETCPVSSLVDLFEAIEARCEEFLEATST